MSSIALGTPRDMRVTAKCQMALFLTVFILWNTWVHISTMNSNNIPANIELLIDNVLSFKTTLGIPNIHPNHYHV